MGRQTSLLLLAFSLSGLVGIQYEILWLRYFTHVAGGGVKSVSAVITAFLLGLALGGAFLGRRADRAEHPLRLYGWLEIGIGVLHLLAFGLFALTDGIYASLYRVLSYETLSVLMFLFAFAFVTLPATLIGGTLPVLLRYFVRNDESAVRDPARLYALNMIGAACGAIGLVVLLGKVGYAESLVIASVVSIAIGVASILIARKVGPPPPLGEEPVAPEGESLSAAAQAPEAEASGAPPAEVVSDSGAPESTPAASEPGEAPAGGEASTGDAVEGGASPAYPVPTGLVLGAYALSGFAALGYEVVWSRELSFLFQGTLISFALVLAMYLSGLAAGTLLALPLARGRDPRVVFGALQALAALLALGSLGYVSHAGVGAGLCLSIMAIMVPLGATFPMAILLCRKQLSVFGKTVGDVYSFNTLGSLSGAFLAGFVLVPTLGSFHTFLLLSLVHGAIGVYFLLRYAKRVPAILAALAVLVAGLGLGLGVPKNQLWEAAHGHEGEQLYCTENALEVLVVAEGEQGDRRLYGGPFLSGSVSRRRVQIIQGHLSMLVHQDPQSVLEIGYGVGEIMRAITTHEPREVDLVEIDPDMVRVANDYFEKINERSSERPGVKEHVLDGRLHLAMTDRSYDVIMSDTFFIYSAASTRLYTLEHFQNGAEHLNPGGVMAVWIPLNMGTERAGLIANTFRQVFPHVLAWRDRFTLFMFGFREPPTLDLNGFWDRFQEKSSQDLKLVGYAHPLDLLGGFTLGSEELAGLFPQGQGEVHRDLRPRLDFIPPGVGDPQAAWTQALDRGGPASLGPYLDLGPPSPRREAFEAMLRDHPAAAALLQEGVGVYDPGDYDEPEEGARAKALELYAQAAAASPHCASARRLLANCASEEGDELREAKDSAGALPFYRRALKASPYDRDSNYQLWRHHLQANQPELAAPYRERCLELQPYLPPPSVE